MYDPNSRIRGRILSNAIGKGGVGKTTLFANVAGLAANGTWKALVVDADPQGNLRLDLGVSEGDTKHGHSLAQAIINGGQPEVIKGVRENLDMVAGGKELQDAVHHMHVTDDVTGLAQAIWPLAENYNIVFIDAPPGEAYMQRAILRAAGHLFIPMRFDRGSIEGLEVIGDRLGEIDDVPVNVLGIALSGFGRTATRMKADVIAECRSILPEIRIFDSVVHDSKKAAKQMRDNGKLAFEYELDAQRAEQISVADRIAANRAGRSVTFSTAAGPLAADYQALTDEVLQAFVESIQGVQQ